jgi:soluble cytochrome b562
MSEAVNSHLHSQLSEFKIKLEQSASNNSDLKKQLEAKEEILLRKNEEKKQMQTAIDELTKTLDSVDQTVKELCGQVKNVSTCKIEAVSTFTEVPYSVKYVKFGSNIHVSVKCSTAIIRVAFGNGRMSLALCAEFCYGFEPVVCFD